MAQNVLVTGGAGYIGSHACKALSAAGYCPVALDNLCLGHRDFVRWGPLVEADIRDREAVVQALLHYDVAAVMHFAAFANVGESIKEPEKYYDNNVGGFMSLLFAMRQTKRSTLIFSSTCATYGIPAVLPIRETTPTEPINPYGQSKLMCETILADFAAAYDLRYIALRYFNACGADPDGTLGELRNIETHLIPRALMYLQGHVQEFAVFGADFSTDDGTPVRDYIHVSDLATAHVLALHHLLAGGDSGAINLGTGQGYSVKQVLAAISRISGRALVPIAGERRAGDPPALVADGQRARNVLGFQPRFSDLDTIIRTAWHWHQRAHPRRDCIQTGTLVAEDRS